MNNKKIKMGMVGGGQGAFIGAIHRAAAAIDGQIELVAGAFSSNPDNCQSTGQALGISTDRCYSTYQLMFESEQALPVDQRIDFVVIVTPNYLHFPIAKCALEHGFHVLSDKPATMDFSEVLMLNDIVNASGRLYGLTHTYTGYPLVKEACYRIKQGELGEITKVVVEYSQGWLADAESESSKQASWRIDPAKAGASCCIGDIGVHAANLAEYVTGLKIMEICADLTSVVNGRTLDDDGTVLLKFDTGAKGVLLASQVAIGEENNLSIRVYGTKAALEWHQQEPNSLYKRYQNQPMQVIRTGVANISPEVNRLLRTPAGHPEGYIEAFANIYLQFIEQIRHFTTANHHNSTENIPGIESAIRGMAFIDSVVAASKQSSKWFPVITLPLPKDDLK